jgi:hypothetical protein
MPVEFDPQLRLFRVLLIGRVDVTRVLATLTEMFAHPNFAPGVPAIWDANDADLSALKREDFHAFREYQAQRVATRGRARIAMVSGNDLEFGFGRMFAQMANLSHLEINVFREMEDAEHWVLERE